MTVERCPATAKTTGQRCGNPAGFKTDHVGFGLCAYHGGSSPGGIKQARRIQAAASASAFGLPIETTPDEALEGELARCAGTVAYLADYLGRLEPERRLAGENAAYVALYERERDRLTRVAKAAIDAGIAERRVAVLERTAEAFASVLRHVLTDLGVIDHPEAPRVVQRRLLALDAPREDGS